MLSQEDLTRERSRLTSDIRETSRRVEEEFEHKLSLQKQKLAALDKQNRDLRAQVRDWTEILEHRLETEHWTGILEHTLETEQGS